MTRRLALLISGVIVLAAIGIVAANRPSAAPMVVTAQFEDAIGLYEGNAVSVLGMEVGRVRTIESKGGYVEVTLAIDHGIDLPADVQAVTVSTSILTDRHVELTPTYRGGPKLKVGDVVGLGRTRTPVEFDKSLAMVDRLSQSMRGDGEGKGPLADLIGVSSAIATGSGADIKATLDRLSQALALGSDDGAQAKRDIQSITTNVADLVAAAADNDGAIREFGANLRQVSDVLAAERLGTGDTGKKLNEVLDRLSTLLRDNRTEFTNALGSADALTKVIAEHRRELAETLDVTPLMVDNMYNAIDQNAGSLRLHILADKTLANGQFTKEVCNMLQLKQLGCATGTMLDYGPDFGLGSMLDLMAGMAPS